ncbi:nucleotidyltransferase family protein [Candidatus Woesearchaeota archaeon]|nr:nucleotidyltransferase family protein [Candidatus Woesearchaeota archaeon]
MKQRTSLKKIERIILPILRKNTVSRAGIFGSFARGESTAKSDLDLLVTFKGKKSLLDLIHLQIELEEVLKKKVDVLTYKSIHPLLKERILNEEVNIL